MNMYIFFLFSVSLLTLLSRRFTLFSPPVIEMLHPGATVILSDAKVNVFRGHKRLVSDKVQFVEMSDGSAMDHLPTRNLSHDRFSHVNTLHSHP